MQDLFKRNKGLKTNDNSGLVNKTYGRRINKNGTPNVKHKGVSFLKRYSWYHTMLNLNMFQFIGFFLLFYLFCNIIFASIYYWIGIEYISGISRGSKLHDYVQLFFFSAQTFTTVGYGRITPIGSLASLTATVEAFFGLMIFAIATGLFYGRFSRPRAFLQFSNNALVTPFKDKTAIAFRVSPYKNNTLSNVEATLTAAITFNENGEHKNYFYHLKVETPKLTNLMIDWSVLHEIDENSPFYNIQSHDFKMTNIELIVQIRAFDEVFADDVVQKTSYFRDEFIIGAKFKPMHFPDENREYTIVNLSLINEYEKVDLPKSSTPTS